MSVVNLVLKPVEQKTYEAMKLTAENRNEFADWCGGSVTSDVHGWQGKPFVTIFRTGRRFWVMEGQWAVRDQYGKFTVYTENELFTKFEEVL